MRGGGTGPARADLPGVSSLARAATAEGGVRTFSSRRARWTYARLSCGTPRLLYCSGCEEEGRRRAGEGRHGTTSAGGRGPGSGRGECRTHDDDTPRHECTTVGEVVRLGSLRQGDEAEQRVERPREDDKVASCSERGGGEGGVMSERESERERTCPGVVRVRDFGHGCR